MLFSIETRKDIDQAAYDQAFGEMYALVTALPGFVGIEGFSNESGQELAVARFQDDASLATWHNLPEHVAMQERGRQEFFERLQITVTDLDREYAWHREVSPERLS